MSIAIITGASSGMGREFALQLDKKEKLDEIWLIARRQDKLEEVAEKLENKSRIIPMDLTVSENIDSLKKYLEEIKPDVKFLINCSGFGKFGRYENIPLQESLNMIDLNIKALVSITEIVLPFMKEGATVVQLDSLSSFQPVPYITVYGASKAFVLSYSRAMNVELKNRNIFMMAVCPGWVNTEFFDRAMTETDKSVNYFNYIYEPADVVRTAIKDMYKRKKDVSIHGFRVRFQVLLVKLLPHKLVMNTWIKQQKKGLNK